MCRVLVVAESLPYPTVKGGDLRTWQQVNALGAWARVAVFGLCSNDRRARTPPDLPLAGWTASTDPALAFPPPVGTRLAARAWLFDPAGHPSDLLYSETAAGELRDVLAGLDPHVVVVEGLWLHRYLDVLAGAGRRIVLDAFNVEAALARELAAAWPGDDLESRVRREVLPSRTAAIEAETVARVDQVWVCSPEDQCRIRELYRPRGSIVVVPNAVCIDGEPGPFSREPPRAPAPTILFLGFFPYEPNAIAADFLIREVFPRLVAKCPEGRLILVGASPPPALRAAAAGEPRIRFTGAVPDVRPFLREATVMAVPLFQGGGTRLKILESFAAGLPVVSTAKGAEGLGTEPGVHLLPAETAEEFAAAAIRLWHDPALARRLAADARALVTERYSWSSSERRVRDALDILGLGR